MYDFCFAFPYAGILFVGGLMGFITKNSVMSLAAGLLSGGLIALFGRASLYFYKKGELCKPATMASMFVSSFIGLVMFNRYEKTKAIFPGGVGAAISAFMTMFYMWSFFLGPEPKKPAAQPKKKGAGKKAKKSD